MRTRIYQLVDSCNIQGIISLSNILGQYITKEELEYFYSQFDDIPIISAGIPLSHTPSVIIDNATGFIDLFVHLIEDHHYEHIAFIQGILSSYDGMQRFNIYKQMIKKYGINNDPALIVPGNFIQRSGRVGVSILLDHRNVAIDAIVASNDYMALGALEECQSRNINVPGEMVVTGFNNIIECHCVKPGLTTVHQPAYKMGKTAFHKLIDYMKGKEGEPVTIIPSQLVIRESCGCLIPGKFFITMTIL
jgi:DNA-binding LacI/PurR family transcriptional regulator